MYQVVGIRQNSEGFLKAQEGPTMSTACMDTAAITSGDRMKETDSSRFHGLREADCGFSCGETVPANGYNNE